MHSWSVASDSCFVGVRLLLPYVSICADLRYESVCVLPLPFHYTNFWVMILLKSDVRLLYYTFLKDVDSCFSINALFY